MRRPADAWEALPEALQAAAAREGRDIDLSRVLAALAGTVAAFQRRRAATGRDALLRRRLQAMARAAEALQDALAALGEDRDGLLGRWPALGTPEAWLEDLARLGDCTRHRLWRSAVVAKPSRRDDPARSMVVETAWILASAGLPVSSYPAGILGLCVRAVAERAGRPLPDDDRNFRRWLRPAVEFVHRNVGAVGASEKSGPSALTERALASVPSPVTRPTTH